MKLAYPACFYPGEEKEGSYAVVVPDLPGCVSGGDSLEEAFFMATDYATSPVTESGKVIFALGCGVITMLIRAFGSYPEGVSFSILLMNILTPHIDNLTRKKPFGGVVK